MTHGRQSTRGPAAPGTRTRMVRRGFGVGLAVFAAIATGMVTIVRTQAPFDSAQGRPAAERVTIKVDAAKRIGPMKPVWAWFGYDEPNYTYMKDGQKLLTELSKLSPVPVFVRTHNLLTTGDGTPGLKWGSTNAYTEDANGKPIYDWTIVDRIIDTYLKRGMKPMMQIGFMPEAMSVKPQPYRHDWQPGVPYNRVYTGWAHPPKDYAKWGELVYQWARHSVQKYGRAEVESWVWEVWNEPDIGYWQSTPEEFFKLYDYAADGLKRALPTARIGGPEVTGPNGARTQKFLRDFIEHCLRGTNHATGKVGSPLDYITFHAKGAPRVVKESETPFVRMSVSNQLRAIANGFSIVASYPELKDMPIVIGESDPEGCAACPVKTDPHNAYRNGTMYSSYTAEQIARTYELADLHKVNLLGSVTWAFEFEDQPYLYGFRDLSTNGLPKPVLNVFRMLGQMGGDRVSVESSGAGSTRDRAGRRGPRARRHHRAREPPGAGGRGPRLELSRRRPARAGCRRDPDHRGAPRLECPGHALPRRSRAQQHLRGVEEDGVAAASVEGPASRAREGRCALRGRADANGHNGWRALSNVPTATAGRVSC